MHRTYRYRLYPTPSQVAALEAQLADACDLYNAALQNRRDMWREHGVVVTEFEQSRELTKMRREGIVPSNVSRYSQRAVLRRLDRAFAAFFRRVKAGEEPGYPRFKPRSRYNTLEYAFGRGLKLTAAGRLYVQAVGHVKVRLHRPIPEGAKLCEARITRRSGRWYVSVMLKDVPTRPLEPTGRSVGLDVGISTFVATSDGQLIPGPRAGRAAAKAVRRAQRKVARRKRGSNRRRKAVAQLARLREHEASVRRDHAHKTARALIEQYDTVVIEDLNLRGLSRGMLARDVNDQGWAGFVALLDEKAESAARRVIRVNPKNTSQACSACGATVRKDLSVRVHRCSCGYVADRDVNAACNVLLRAGPIGAVRRERWGEEARAVA